jgi:hypothetical protein
MTDATLAERLAIRPGNAVWFEPIEWLRVLGPLPPGAHMVGDFAAATVAVVFVSNAGSVRWFLDRYRTVMTRPHAVWVCYPTRGRSDFNRGTLNTMLGGHGLHVVEEVTLDPSWTALQVRHVGLGAPPPSLG